MPTQTIFQNNVTPDTIENGSLAPGAVEQTAKINTLVDKSNRVLFRATAVFPFDLFPDSIVVDETKVALKKKIFFYSEVVRSILIKDIIDVSVSRSPFFSTLTVYITGFETDPAPINFLPTWKAAKARRIIMGLIACYKEGIDTSNIPDGEFTRKIEEIGRVHS